MLGQIYNIKVPTATEFRKKLATVAADKCSSTEVCLLSKQMSHNELLHGSKHAAEVKRRFTIEETETIEKWFNDFIEKEVPSLPNCRLFVAIFDVYRKIQKRYKRQSEKPNKS